MLLWSAVAVAVIALGAYKLGVFLRPEFVYQDRLIENGDELWAIVATTTEKNIGKHVGRLLENSLKVMNELPQGKVWMQTAAKMYGSPEGSDKLSVGLWFEDPKLSDAPRWAVGWAIPMTVAPLEELQNTLVAIREKLGLNDQPIRAVRLGTDHVLKGSIPWRSMFTPMVGAMIQWSRAYQAYEKGGYKANSGCDIGDGSVALEVYISGPNDKMEQIDYVVLFGDTRNIVRDAFPLDETLSSQEQKTAVE